MTGVTRAAVTSVADRGVIPEADLAERLLLAIYLHYSRRQYPTQAAPSQGSSYHSHQLDAPMPGADCFARANQVR